MHGDFPTIIGSIGVGLLLLAYLLNLIKRVSQNCSNLAIQDIKTVGCGIALTAKLQQFVRYQPLNSGFNDGRQHVTDECCG